MGTETALIFGACGYGDWSFLTGFLGKVTVFCADGGCRLAAEAGFPIHYYIGDGDSGGTPPDGVEAVILKPEKDLTDMQAAYEHARMLGFRNLVLTACTGGRQDHHLANLQLLERAELDGVQAEILDPVNRIRYINGGRLEIWPGIYRYFSILPLDYEIHGVRITGAKYPLNAETVRRGDSLTVSNETLSGPATIEIASGAAWIIQSERIS